MKCVFSINLFVFVVIFILSLHLSVSASAFVGDSDDGKVNEQDFLFLLEEGYSQEQAEWQVSLDYQYARYKLAHRQNKAQDDIWLFAIEYGITDRLQVGFSQFYQQNKLYRGRQQHNTSTLGNPSFEIAYQIIQEGHRLPATSIVFAIEIPAGTEKEPIGSDNWGYEGAVNSSKYIEGLGFFHAGLAYERTEHGDETEFTYGIGFVRSFNDALSGMIECLFSHETELGRDTKETEKVVQWSLGVNYQSDSEVVIGFAYGRSNDVHNLEHSLRFKIQYEF
jgi:hypothetical protein